ncbi:hypothetical protein [Clostridium minihomine]|nr:hypothetical protein [Clostridium minihomine]
MAERKAEQKKPFKRMTILLGGNHTEWMQERQRFCGEEFLNTSFW